MRLTKYRGKWALAIDGKRLSTGVDARPECRAAAERAARDILKAKAAARPMGACGDIINAWIADMPYRPQPKIPSPGVVYAAAAVARFFADHAPAAVTRAESRAYIAARRADGRADGTIRKELGVLAAALRWAGHAPTLDMPFPGAPRTRWLTRAEIAAILARDDLPPHIRSFIHIGICTGARAEAILTLRWSQNVDFDNGRIWPGVKIGGKRRAQPAPMTAAARQWLTAARDIAQSDFVIEWAGRPVKSVKRALKRAYDRAGVENIDAPAHVLRHTAGAWMAIDGVDMHQIARRLGHSSITTTERYYAHLHPDYMGASTRALEI